MRRTRTVIFALCAITLNTIAQSKKEMLQSITEMGQTLILQGQLIDSLAEKYTVMESKLKEMTNDIAILKEDNASQKEIIARLEKSSKEASTTPMTYKDSILSVVKDYLACDTWEDRLKYVMEPGRVRPMMESYYKEKGYRSAIYQHSLLSGSSTFEKIQGKKHVIHLLDGKYGYYLIKIDGEYKIDWEATTEYNATSLEEMSKFPNKTFEYRTCIIESSAWVRNGYRFFDIGDYSYGYVEMSTPLAKRLKELARGIDKETIIQIRFSESQGDTLFFDIVGIVSESFSKY